MQTNLSVSSFAELPDPAELPDHTTAHVTDSDTRWRTIPGGWVLCQMLPPEQVEQVRQVVREEIARHALVAGLRGHAMGDGNETP